VRQDGRGFNDSTNVEWKATDGSWVRVSKGGGRHGGSMRGGHTECDIFVNGAAVHVDAGDWGDGERAGFMTNAYFDFGPMAPSTPSVPGGRTRAFQSSSEQERRKPGLHFQAFSRSRERHAELLKALRSIAILPTWGAE
jgi:hypothetical protein